MKEAAAEEVPSVGQTLTWLHCSVGPELTQEEEEEDRTQVRKLQLRHLSDCHSPALNCFRRQPRSNL